MELHKKYIIYVIPSSSLVQWFQYNLIQHKKCNVIPLSSMSSGFSGNYLKCIHFKKLPIKPDDILLKLLMPQSEYKQTRDCLTTVMGQENFSKLVKFNWKIGTLYKILYF